MLRNYKNVIRPFEMILNTNNRIKKLKNQRYRNTKNQNIET